MNDTKTFSYNFYSQVLFVSSYIEIIKKCFCIIHCESPVYTIYLIHLNIDINLQVFFYLGVEFIEKKRLF